MDPWSTSKKTMKVPRVLYERIHVHITRVVKSDSSRIGVKRFFSSNQVKIKWCPNRGTVTLNPPQHGLGLNDKSSIPLNNFFCYLICSEWIVTPK